MTSRRRTILAAALCSLLTLQPGAPPTTAHADPPTDSANGPDANASALGGPIAGPAGPYAEPVVRLDLLLQARAARAWVEGDTRYLLLEHDARFTAGTYGLGCDRALVRIDTAGPAGKPVRHVLLYLDQARPLRDAGPVRAQAPRLLVTLSTTGSIALDADSLRQSVPEPSAFLDDARDRFQQYRTRELGPALAVDPRPLFPDHQLADRQTRRRAVAQSVNAQVGQAQQAIFDQARAQAAQSQQDAPTPGANASAPTAPGANASAVTAPTSSTPTDQPTPTPIDLEGRIIPLDAIVSFSADKIIYQQPDPAPLKPGASDPDSPSTSSPDGPTVLLIGNVRVMVESRSTGRTMTLSAENAVLFLAPAPGATASAVAASTPDLPGDGRSARVHGIYLEDNVQATDGTYSVRAPRVYYDVPGNRATLLEAVFYTWDPVRQIPLYLRGQKLRQESRTRWSARNATLTTTDFARPRLSIAASTLTLDRVSRPGSPESDPAIASVKYRAERPVIRAGGLPVFGWPSISGEAGEVPLRSVRVDASGNNGPSIRTRWDLFALTGRPAPDGVSLLGTLGYLGEHGPVVGADLAYELPRMTGRFHGELLPIDNANSALADRLPVDFDNDPRGTALWQHRHRVLGGWELSLEAAYASDPVYLEQFETGRAQTAKPYETSLYLKRQQDDWALTFLTKYTANDFLVQTPELQARGYGVEKLPELAYYRVASPLLQNRLTWYSENRLSRMLIRPDTRTPARRGFTNALLLFNLPDAVTSFDAAYTAAGLSDDWAARLDSRQEIQAPLKLAVFDVVPYAAARLTAYDDDFDSFIPTSEPYRALGTVGLRLATHFARTRPDARSRLLDLQQIRHIVEPSLDIAYTAASLDPGELPVFDPEVESWADGYFLRLGLRNTWQTRRGGNRSERRHGIDPFNPRNGSAATDNPDPTADAAVPDPDPRWRSVDWIVLDTELVTREREPAPLTLAATPVSAISRYFSYRPEYTTGGDHLHSNLLWLVTDSLALTGDVVWGMDSGTTESLHLGAVLQHTPAFSTYVDYAQLDFLDSQLLTYGMTWQLTRRYALGLSHDFNVGGANAARVVELTLERRLPQARLLLFASFDDTQRDTTIGLLVVPEGLRTGRLLTPLGVIRDE